MHKFHFVNDSFDFIGSGSLLSAPHRGHPFPGNLVSSK